MEISSPVFDQGEIIPSLYSYREGKNINPELHFHNIPPNAKSLALIIDDHEVPRNLMPSGIYDHWVLFNIPPTTKVIEAGAKKPPGTQGKNSDGQSLYIGPAPPDKEHRYNFRLYALDCALNLDTSATKDEVLAAMKNHILAEAHLMGRYEQGKGY